MASDDRSLTRILSELSEGKGVPLSTLKLNARVLRGLNLISYGSVQDPRPACVEPLGRLVLKMVEEPGRATIRFAD